MKVHRKERGFFRQYDPKQDVYRGAEIGGRIHIRLLYFNANILYQNKSKLFLSI